MQGNDEIVDDDAFDGKMNGKMKIKHKAQQSETIGIPQVKMKQGKHLMLDKVIISFEHLSQETLLQIEKKNPLLMVYYLFMCPSFTSRRRYRGKLVEPFSIKDQIATIECRGFPDNLACNLQKIKRFQRKLIRIGATVSFGVRLSDNPSYYFQAEYPFIIDHNEQDEHQRFRSRGMGQYDGEGESDDFEEDTLWNSQNVEKQRNGSNLSASIIELVLSTNIKLELPTKRMAGMASTAFTI
ncbi:MAG: hypothetical protein EZS28_019971 [Streblomastix strix]|uniref:Uncharacterized protein n=1 Tax=Streblomastix strix TaxID=222440 RepID=A0A5J4VPS6_9EUKA|nr:MAG: hypothetical protein EZS28_019971 [Streblomastix strix]